jgi:site-specific recombinase XerD
VRERADWDLTSFFFPSRLSAFQRCLTCLTHGNGPPPGLSPDPLQITCATALVNQGVSLQSLMILLGHQSADMSMRYGRLFDSTVRTEYEKALTPGGR